ncbi:helix-turn-helix domain-containing protein [Halarcobacter anaerophilus]|uniref:AraC family transcriptional regulator n=1 Tax=Halarcobacter anaerophilus TaxID=877500 RepID=A0A4Q0XWQ1_9BACT|nr:helix-turn-helix domain-containing protein [Halarcobacter anaerophilus]QDF28009.1 transcriptional regulator, AraC family [Halarcobacter anaerophilus]RXJ61445.1 AraC family transcriptional regulator [Halarcobacter anaerophilus]
MNEIQEINYENLFNIKKKIQNPFSREIFITSIKENIGKGFSIWYDMGNGIALFARKFTPKKDFIMKESSNVSGAVFIFNLGEEFPFTFKDNQKFLMKKNNFLIGLSSNEFYAKTYHKKDKEYFILSIGMKEELFSKLAHSIENIDEYMNKAKEKSYELFYNKQIDGQQFEILNYFKDETSYEDLLKNIFLESKTNDLIHYTIQRAARILNNKELVFNDKNRIASLKRAKQLILEEYQNNLSIKEIAYKSAINECYLKKDFKAYYGITIHEMLQKQRLKAAMQLLKKDFSVKEAALKVGYKHTGHFSKIFSNRFGITPSHYKKQLNS